MTTKTTTKPRPLTKGQQAIMDAVKSGAKVVRVVWTKTSSRGRGVSMRRMERVELRDGKTRVPVRADTAERLERRGLLKIHNQDRDDFLGEFTQAVRDGDTEKANAVVQRAGRKYA